MLTPAPSEADPLATRLVTGLAVGPIEKTRDTGVDPVPSRYLTDVG
jgi:hypothetical protein